MKIGSVLSFHTVLFILTLSGMTWVPQRIIPFAVWPLLLGCSYLVYVTLHVVKLRTFQDQDFGPASVAVFCTTLGAGILFFPGSIRVPFLVAAGSTLMGGIAWSAWRASKGVR